MDIAEIRRKVKQLREKVEEPLQFPQIWETPVTMKEIEEHPAEYEVVEETPYQEPPVLKEEALPKAEEEGPETASEPETVEEVKEEKVEPAETAEEEVEAITFMLDNEEYAVDIHQVKEVIKTRELTEIPRAPRDITGIISLRGTVVPIMNLRGRIGMPPRDGGKRIIIVKDGAGLLGLIVDDVKHVIRVSRKDIEPPPAINTIDGEFIRGIGRYKGGMFILLEMEKILEKM